jgi:hypothetical protein
VSRATSFRNALEGWIDSSELHNRVHVWVGGAMGPMTSPHDPVFFLHHCNVDRIWALWQQQRRDAPYLPVTGGPTGHNQHDPMWPWPWGSETRQITPADMLDHAALGYRYDTEGFFFIESPLNGQVLEIRDALIEPGKGTQIVMYPREPSGNSHQMWQLAPAGGGPYFFIRIREANVYVLDIFGAHTEPGTNIIAYPQKTHDTDNQLWQLVPSGTEPSFFIQSRLNSYVLDIFGAHTEPGTNVIAYPRKTSGTSNQLWRLVPAD